MTRGFILYEALIAMTLLALSFLAVCQVGAQVGSLERVQVAQGRAESAVIRQIELLRGLDFAALPARNNTAFDWNVDVDGNGKNDKTLINVALEKPNLARVSLSVTWGNGKVPRHLTRTVRMTDRHAVKG
jgi:Tfp pilus assembly protein PilV